MQERMEERSVQERILDAAEMLFANRGYGGASIRAISREAGVDLGMSGYYFGTKDDLFRAVIERRAGVLCHDLLAALGRAKASQRPTVESILDAYIGSHAAHVVSGDLGWRHYMKLAGHGALLEHRSDLTEPLRQEYAPVAEAYIAALCQALPHRTATQVAVDFRLFAVTVATFAGDARWMGEHLGGGLRRPQEIAQALRRFCLYGLSGEAPAST